MGHAEPNLREEQHEARTEQAEPAERLNWETPKTRGRFRAGDGPALHPLHLSITQQSAMQGRSVDEYRAPLFLAWQLTNRCSARCIACCEESGPGQGLAR